MTRTTLNRAALATWEGAWRAMVNSSALGRATALSRSAVSSRIGKFLPTSVAARIAPGLSLVTLGLLMFFSPFAGTGLNALLVVIGAGAALLHGTSHPATEEASSTLDVPVVALAAILVLAAAASPFPWASTKGLAKFAVYGVAFLVFRDAIRRGGPWIWVPIVGLLAAGFCEAFYGLYQFKIKVSPLATWEDVETDLHLTRVYGTLRNPNLLGGYLVAIVPLAVAGAINWKGLVRWLAIGVAVIGPLCLYFTYSRGAYLGLAVEALVLGILGLFAGRGRWQTYLLALGVVALMGGGAWWAWENVPSFAGRIASIATPFGDSSNSFRMNVWISTLLMIKDSWWLGVGIGNDSFRHGYAMYMESGFEALGAYNIFLEWAAEAGVFGLIAFCWLLFASAARAIVAFIDGVARPWAAAIMATLAGLLVHGMVDTVFFRPEIQLPFWWVLAMVCGLNRLAGRPSSGPAGLS